jgi:hypothetical protein
LLDFVIGQGAPAVEAFKWRQIEQALRIAEQDRGKIEQQFLDAVLAHQLTV